MSSSLFSEAQYHANLAHRIETRHYTGKHVVEREPPTYAALSGVRGTGPQRSTGSLLPPPEKPGVFLTAVNPLSIPLTPNSAARALQREECEKALHPELKIGMGDRGKIRLHEFEPASQPALTPRSQPTPWRPAEPELPASRPPMAAPRSTMQEPHAMAAPRPPISQLPREAIEPNVRYGAGALSTTW